MNTAKRQSARPGDYGAKPGHGCPPEVRAMARQMGIPAKDFGELSDQLWGKLTALSSEDPSAHDRPRGKKRRRPFLD